MPLPIYRRATVGRHAVIGALTLFLTCVALTSPTQASDATTQGTFLFRVLRFVVWPEVALAPGSTLRVCTIAADDVGAALSTAASGNTIRGHSISVEAITDIDAAEGCQVLFMAETNRKKLRRAAMALSGKPMLSVATSKIFAEFGGVIGIDMRRNKVALAVNRTAARRANLNISARLLRLAEVFD